MVRVQKRHRRHATRVTEPEGSTPGRVPVERLHVHQAIVDRLDLSSGDILLDLGCGNGSTLATAVSRVAGLSLIGMDADAGALAGAQSWLAETDARCEWLQGDAGSPLPLPDASVTRVVCHDVLEYLADPVRLLAEASRVMRSGAVSVWSHTDYDAIVIGGADRLLTRRIMNAYADASYLDLAQCDAQMGRKLTAVVDRSPLQRTTVGAAVLIATTLEDPGRRRIDDIAATVVGGGRRGEIDVAPEEVEEWVAQLIASDQRGDFFYSQTAYIVTATHPVR